MKSSPRPDAFFAALLDRLGLSRDRLFVVPGNHDVDRSIHPEAWKKLRQTAAEADELTFARWIAGGDPPRGMDSGWIDQVLERQAAYYSWVRLGLGRPELDPAQGPHGRLGYRVKLERRGVPIHVIGLDSAWLCGDDADTGRLRVTDEQVMRLLAGDQGRPLNGLRLVMMHHPLHRLGGRRPGPCLARRARGPRPAGASPRHRAFDLGRPGSSAAPVGCRLSLRGRLGRSLAERVSGGHSRP